MGGFRGMKEREGLKHARNFLVSIITGTKDMCHWDNYLHSIVLYIDSLCLLGLIVCK